jgi:hypothetical protein
MLKITNHYIKSNHRVIKKREVDTYGQLVRAEALMFDFVIIFYFNGTQSTVNKSLDGSMDPG